MQEENTLVGLDAIGPAFEKIAGEDVGSIVAMVVDTGVAVVVDAKAEMGLTGTRDKDAQVGSEEDVGILAGQIVGFEGAAIDGDHEAATGDSDVGGEMDFGGGADIEEAAAG